MPEYKAELREKYMVKSTKNGEYLLNSIVDILSLNSLDDFGSTYLLYTHLSSPTFFKELSRNLLSLRGVDGINKVRDGLLSRDRDVFNGCVNQIRIATYMRKSRFIVKEFEPRITNNLGEYKKSDIKVFDKHTDQSIYIEISELKDPDILNELRKVLEIQTGVLGWALDFEQWSYFHLDEKERESIHQKMLYELNKTLCEARSSGLTVDLNIEGIFYGKIGKNVAGMRLGDEVIPSENVFYRLKAKIKTELAQIPKDCPSLIVIYGMGKTLANYAIMSKILEELSPLAPSLYGVVLGSMVGNFKSSSLFLSKGFDLKISRSTATNLKLFCSLYKDVIS